MAHTADTRTSTGISDTVEITGHYSLSVRMDGGNSSVQLQRSFDSGTTWGIVSYISEPKELDLYSAATALYRVSITDMPGTISVSYWLGNEAV